MQSERTLEELDKVEEIGNRKEKMKEKIRADIFNLEKRFRELEKSAYSKRSDSQQKKINYNKDIYLLPNLISPIKFSHKRPNSSGSRKLDCDMKYDLMKKLSQYNFLDESMARCISLGRMNLQHEKDLVTKNIQDLIEDKKNSLGLYYRYIRNMEELFKREDDLERKSKDYRFYFREKVEQFSQFYLSTDKVKKVVLNKLN